MHQLGPAEKVAPLVSQSERTAAGQWLVLAAALLGWMFDGVEMGLFPAVGPSALHDLLGLTGTDTTLIGQWNSYITAGFLLGAACGGILFGWLGDRIGRVRAMALSILTYSLFTAACFFITAAWQFAALRFIAALGMGGEWALGVALVVECWPERFRPVLAGVIGAAGNLGYLMIAAAVTRFPVTPGHWRWTMLACAVRRCSPWSLWHFCRSRRAGKELCATRPSGPCAKSSRRSSFGRPCWRSGWRRWR